MSRAVSQFVRLVRTVSLWLYCETCGKTTLHHLARETGRVEVYECGACGTQKEYTVR